MPQEFTPSHLRFFKLVDEKLKVPGLLTDEVKEALAKLHDEARNVLMKNVLFPRSALENAAQIAAQSVIVAYQLAKLDVPVEAAKQGLCDITAIAHDQLAEEIRAEALASMHRPS